MLLFFFGGGGGAQRTKSKSQAIFSSYKYLEGKDQSKILESDQPWPVWKANQQPDWPFSTYMFGLNRNKGSKKIVRVMKNWVVEWRAFRKIVAIKIKSLVLAGTLSFHMIPHIAGFITKTSRGIRVEEAFPTKISEETVLFQLTASSVEQQQNGIENNNFTSSKLLIVYYYFVAVNVS